MNYRVLVINPGSTSTKIAVFEGKEKLFDTTLRYSTEELASFGWVMEQVDFRRATIEKALADNNIDPDSLDAICARGGQVPYCAAGTYRVDQAMVDFMYTRRQGAHASNLGCVLALLLAKPLGIPAYIVDPVMVDEMDDVARVSGLPELPRKMQGHALNCRAMAIRCADEVLHKPLADCRLIVLHLGGGSCRLFVDGRMVDCVRDDEWMFAPERFGGAAIQDVVTLCYSGKYTESEMMGFVRGKGGLVAHLGTSNAIEVEKRIEEGDSHAKLVYDGMLYSNVRAIGALAAAADGKIDRIILTGGLAHSKYVAAYITKKVSFIAPVEVMAGEFELEALAAGACRVLDGEELSPGEVRKLMIGRAAGFLGEAGCGKSELAVHLALSLAGKGREVHFFDLDQTKPLMRSRDAQELLEGAGVTVHFERQTADAPTQVGGLVPLLLAPDKNVILDVGGGDAGARLIGGYSHLLKNADVWFIVNPYRPWSGSTEHIDGTLSAILRAARLKLPRFLLNPNLGQETTAEEYLAGLEDGLAVLSPYVPVEGAAVPAALLARVAALAPLPLIPITTHISVPETELD